MTALLDRLVPRVGPAPSSNSPTKVAVMEALKELFGGEETGYKHDASGTPATVGYVHGPSALFNYPGVDPAVFSTVVGFLPGVQARIPAYPSQFMAPTYTILTGWQFGSGEEPTAECDDAPIGGPAKAVTVTSTFGRLARDTREIHISRLGQMMDRAEPMDLTLVNRPNGDGPFGTSYGPMGDVLVNEMAAVFTERGNRFFADLSKMTWEGNPLGGTTGYSEFAGLNLLVDQSVKDIYGATQPSLAASITAYDSRIDASAQSGQDLVNICTYKARNLKQLATRSGIAPVTWAFVMPEALFYELTKVWPCAYFTTVCDLSSSGVYQQNVDNGDVIAMRDRMRNEQYLLIDGQQWPVILDDSMTVEDNSDDGAIPSGCFRSDIVILPFRAGGRQVLYYEYFNYSNSQIQALLAGGRGPRAWVSGAYLETDAQTHGCFKWQAEIRPRLVLRTPWLAAKVTGVIYCPLEMYRQPYVDDPYHVNGGSTYLEHRGETYVNPWE